MALNFLTTYIYIYIYIQTVKEVYFDHYYQNYEACCFSFFLFFERKKPCERGREDEDDGEQRVNAIFIFLFLIRRINDLVTNF